MPRVQPPKDCRFKKCQSGNPGGRPKLPEHLKEIKEFNDQELKRIISKYFRMTKPECKEASESDDLPMVELAIASALQTSVRYGEISKIIPLIERVCGKVKDKFEHTDGTQMERDRLKAMSDRELIETVIKHRPEGMK